jgi:organic hydroperoxide reductase OsmC/OhrA
MIQYPMHFTTFAQASQGSATTWNTWAQAHPEPVIMAIPPEFQGPGTGLSPEDLYAMALQNCFVATFKVFAEKSKFNFEKISVQAVLDVDRNAEGKPFMARIKLRVSLSGVAQEATAQRLLEKVSQNCMILNSVLSEKSFDFEILSS